MGCIGLCFVRVLSVGCLVCQYQCKWLTAKTRLRNDYNDPAHSLTVFSLIPVWLVMALLTVVIHDWIILPCYVLLICLLTIIMLKIFINHKHWKTLFIIQNPMIVNRNSDFFKKTNRFMIRIGSIRIANRNALQSILYDFRTSYRMCSATYCWEELN